MKNKVDSRACLAAGLYVSAPPRLLYFNEYNNRGDAEALSGHFLSLEKYTQMSRKPHASHFGFRAVQVYRP